MSIYAMSLQASPHPHSILTTLIISAFFTYLLLYKILFVVFQCKENTVMKKRGRKE